MRLAAVLIASLSLPTCLDGGRVRPLDVNPQSVAWDDRSAAELLAALAE